MKLWLDDVRTAPEGWTHVLTVEQAKAALQTGTVEEASLDHDLGACDLCTAVERSQTDGRLWDGNMPHCDHVGTGYTLVLWMAEHGIWPTTKPVVHSMNPVGRDRMRGVIDRYFPTTATEQVR